LKDLLKELNDKPEDKKFSSERLFLEFKYPEIKDLLKHFLTLISATLVFSITFSEKVINYSSASNYQRVLVISSWVLLVIALFTCGASIYTLYLAADEAITTLVSGGKREFKTFKKQSYFFQNITGVVFCISLSVLVISAIAR
jgi:hypothetical protein